MRFQKWMWIAWPAFLVACVLEMTVFALIDPAELHGPGGGPLALSREAFYTLSFFVFWGLLMVSGALTTLLSRSPFEVNQCPLAPDQRRPEACDPRA